MIIPSRAAVDALCGCRTTLYQRIAGIIAPVLYAGLFVFLALQWRTLPEQIPTHFDISGNVTGYGSKWVLILLPAIGVVTDIAMAVSMRFPKSWSTGVKVTVFNRARVYKVFRDLMADMRISCAVLFILISVFIVAAPTGLPGWASALIALLIVIPILRYYIRLLRSR